MTPRVSELAKLWLPTLALIFLLTFLQIIWTVLLLPTNLRLRADFPFAFQTCQASLDLDVGSSWLPCPPMFVFLTLLLLLPFDNQTIKIQPPLPCALFFFFFLQYLPYCSVQCSGIKHNISRGLPVFFFFIIYLFLLNGTVVVLQCCVNFCSTTSWFSYTHTHTHTHTHIYTCILF